MYFRLISKSRLIGAACHSRISMEAQVFHDISANQQQVMRELEEQTARDQRSLRSVFTDVGRCLSLLAMSAPHGPFLELGSSGGYSSLWLSLRSEERRVGKECRGR